VYVANSEPAIWQRGVERADVSERVPISRHSHGGLQETSLCGAGRDTGRLYVLPREALLI